MRRSFEAPLVELLSHKDANDLGEYGSCSYQMVGYLLGMLVLTPYLGYLLENVLEFNRKVAARLHQKIIYFLGFGRHCLGKCLGLLYSVFYLGHDISHILHLGHNLCDVAEPLPDLHCGSLYLLVLRLEGRQPFTQF